MPLLAKFRSLLENVFFGRRVDSELDQEVKSHLEMLVEEHLESGMTRAEARRTAQLEIGGMEQVNEQVRKERIGNWLRSVVSDCRYSIPAPAESSDVRRRGGADPGVGDRAAATAKLRTSLFFGHPCPMRHQVGFRNPC